MRKLSTLALATALASTMAVSAFAAPAPAAAGDAGTTPSQVFQELGNVVDANTILIGTTLASAVAGGPLTVGATTINNLTVGLGNNLEVRTGALPNGIGANGATVKYAGFVPGLAIYGGFGSNSTSPANTGSSAWAIGAAYEMAMNGFLINGNAQLSGLSATPVAGTTNTNSLMDLSGAAYYPFTPNVLLAGQVSYSNNSIPTAGVAGGSTSNMNIAAGARLHKDNWVIDALVLLNNSGTTTPPAPGVATTGGVFSMGAPILVNVSYIF